jgi:hypothetical protein
MEQDEVKPWSESRRRHAELGKWALSAKPEDFTSQRRFF